MRDFVSDFSYFCSRYLHHIAWVLWGDMILLLHAFIHRKKLVIPTNWPQIFDLKDIFTRVITIWLYSEVLSITPCWNMISGALVLRYRSFSLLRMLEHAKSVTRMIRLKVCAVKFWHISACSVDCYMCYKDCFSTYGEMVSARFSAFAKMQFKPRNHPCTVSYRIRCCVRLLPMVW